MEHLVLMELLELNVASKKVIEHSRKQYVSQDGIWAPTKE